jgi:L-fuconolactonase
VIDSHVHVWPAGRRHPAQIGPVILVATTDDLETTLRSAGVRAAVIIQTSITDERTFLRSISDLPTDRYARAIRWAAPSAGASLKMEALVRQGVRGIRLDLVTPIGEPLIDELTAICRAADEQGMVVDWLARPDRLHVVGEIGRRLPALIQVIDHLGLPRDLTDRAELDAVVSLAVYPGVHIKLSGFHAFSKLSSPYADCRTWIEEIVSSFGGERVMWGSNWPLSIEFESYQALIDLPLGDGPLPDSVWSETAERIWFSNASAGH